MSKVLYYLTQCWELFKSVIEHFFAFILVIVLPATSNLYFIGLLILVDTITGIWGSINQEGVKAFQSKKLQNGLVPKLILYPLIILIGAGAQHIFPEIPFLKGATFFIMVWEFKSLEENFGKIFGTSFIKLFKTLITKGRKGFIEELSKNDKNS
jgi:hypothetical protein